MMLQSTRFRFNGLIIETDNPNLEDTAQVALDILIAFLVQLNLLVIEFRTLTQFNTVIARRVIAIMDAIREIGEIIAIAPALAVERMAEAWGLFWFKLSWRY